MHRPMGLWAELMEDTDSVLRDPREAASKML